MPIHSKVFYYCLIGLITVSARQEYAPAEDYDIYLLAGQSNMDGRGDTSDLSDELRQPVSDAMIFYRSPQKSSGGWRELRPGFSVPPGYKGKLPSPKFGPEIGFARAMLQSDPQQKLALIKGSKGGTSLRSDWKPGTTGDAVSQGPLYREFLESIRMATTQLQEQGHTFQIRGVLWHQGESDAKSSVNAYETRLSELIRRLRQDLKIEHLPFVAGEVYDNGKRDNVLAAIRAVASNTPATSLISSEETTTWDDGTHFDAASQLLLGRRYAAAMANLVSDEPESRAR